MSVPVSLDAALVQISSHWDTLLDSFNGLNDSVLNEPSAVGHWSAGDLAFHIAFWDEIAGFDAQFRHDNAGAAPSPRDWQALNDEDYARHRARPAVDGFTVMHATHEAMLRLFASLPGDDFAWAVAELGDHYKEHADDIRAWRETRGI